MQGEEDVGLGLARLTQVSEEEAGVDGGAELGLRVDEVEGGGVHGVVTAPGVAQYLARGEFLRRGKNGAHQSTTARTR